MLQNRNITIESAAANYGRAIKKSFGVIAMAAVIMFSAVSCGGGSGLQKNKYLGSFPAIYADYKLAMTNCSGETDPEKLEKKKAEIIAKYEASVKAESKKMAGTEIPVTYSEEFKKLNLHFDIGAIKITEATIEEDDKLFLRYSAPIAATEDFVVDGSNRYDYQFVWFRTLAKDGSIIQKGFFYLFSLEKGENKSFSKGQSLMREGGDAGSLFIISSNTEKWVHFAGIEILSQAEFRAIDDKYLY